MNGYGTNESEFVRATDDREGTVTSDTIINKGTVITPNNQNFSLTFDNVYHGTNIYFDDFLGSSTYNRSSVSFELIGEKNTFQFGTGGGAGHRGWFTFASAAITPIMQEAPAKTVQPLQQYQANDTWNSPSGEASGWAQRFYNDLDRLGADEPPQGPWELLSKHRVSGHDADIPDELADGVPQKAERYVERGKEYYYFINQPTINLVSEGLVTPSGYQIVDTLPDSVEFLSAELFDLKGNAMGKINSSTSPPLLTFTLSEDQVSTINAQSKEPDYYGEDFSIRILFRVKDDADSQTIDNKAYSVFSYPDNISFKQQSNTVQIKVKEIGGSIEIKKTDSFGMDTPVAGTAFSLYQLDDEKEDKKGEQFGEEKWTVAGKTLVFEGLPVGRYVLSETGTVGKFVKGTDFYFDITETGETVWLDKSGEALAQQPDGVDVIINTKGYDLSLLKTDDSENGLPGAVFTLSGEGLAESIEVTSNESGSISFADGILQAGGEYTLTETKAPSGYLTSSEGPWKISITTDGLRAIIRAKDGTTTDLTVTTSDIAPDEYYQITGPDGFSIKNYPQVPLPATGGPGVWSYFIVGAFIIGCALIRRTMTAKGGRY